MSLSRIDPLFNNASLPTKKTEITAAFDTTPTSPISRAPMQLVEGAFEGRTFKMWIDAQNRIAIPAKSN